MRKQMPESWQLAGMISDLDTLDRPSDSWEIEVPTTLHLHGEYLRWWFWEDDPDAKEDLKVLPDGPFRFALPPTDVLTRFVELRNGPPDEILRFANQWGTLGGRHGNFHTWAPGLLREKVEGAADLPGRYAESIVGWVKVARLAYSILNIAAKLHRDELGEASDWAVIKPWDLLVPGLRPSRKFRDQMMEAMCDTVSAQKRVLASEINNWLKIGEAKLSLAWANPSSGADKKPRISLNGRASVFGVIAVQLVLAVSRSSGLCTCSSCGEPYAPSRRPPRGRRNYCPRCRGKKVPGRDASRDYYNRCREGDGGRHGS